MDLNNINKLEPVNGRNPNGTFAVGHFASNGSKPYRYAARAAQLEEQMTTAEILSLADDDDALGKRPAIDTIVIRRLARAMKNLTPTSCADIERAADSHLERVEGRPKGNDTIDGGAKVVIQIVQFGNVQSDAKVIDNGDS